MLGRCFNRRVCIIWLFSRFAIPLRNCGDNGLLSGLTNQQPSHLRVGALGTSSGAWSYLLFHPCEWCNAKGRASASGAYCVTGMPPTATISSVLPPPRNPFMRGFSPSMGESDLERARRKREVAEAMAISNAIDEQIQHEKVAATRKHGYAAKVLLLGQWGNGKSTIIEKFSDWNVHENTEVVMLPGVQERHFRIPGASGALEDWTLYEIHDSHTFRHAWCPYFDNVDSIIFLAPVDSFDEVSTGETRVNRLNEIFLQWKHVCECKLLANVQLVLFLTEIDSLRSKLESGVRFSNYVTSYGDRPNDVPSVTSFLQAHFGFIHRSSSGSQRPFYCYSTLHGDHAMALTLKGAVQEGILRRHLSKYLEEETGPV